jgi:DNA repair ATPase RecN
MAEHRSHRDDFLDLDEDPRTSSAPTVEQIDDQVAQAQERLIALKRQAEQLEREKQKLEELSRRQEQFDTGRAEMVDKFTSSLVHIQRETDQTLKRLEILKNVQENFSTYLQELEAINPKDWTPADLNKELSKGLGAVEDARSVYVKAQAQIAVDDDAPASGSPYESEIVSGGHSFGYWLMAGFAFTLPLTALGLIGLLLWFIQLGSSN